MDQAESKKSSESNVKRQKIYPEISDRKDEITDCLDTLAWLLQSSTASCTAVSLVNTHLLIADNYISESTTIEYGGVIYINKVLDYLSKIADSTATSQIKRDIVKEICLIKFKGEGKGYVNSPFSRQELESIVNLFGNVYFDEISLVNQYFVSVDKYVNLLGHSNPKVSAAITVGNDVLRRLARVENFLRQGNSELKKAILGGGIDKIKEHHADCFLRLSPYGAVNYKDHIWLRKDASGYAIIATHYQDGESVHGEMKIIDFLLASRILTADTKSGKYRIGVSKRCCPKCFEIIKLMNDILEEEIINVRGHKIIRGWEKPIFLLQPREDQFACPEAGLYFAHNNSIEGYFFVRENGVNSTYPLLSLANYENEKKALEKSGIIVEGTYLYRDSHLIELIRKQFSHNEYKEASPSEDQNMSQPTPEQEIGQSETPQSILSDIGLLIAKLETKLESVGLTEDQKLEVVESIQKDVNTPLANLIIDLSRNRTASSPLSSQSVFTNREIKSSAESGGRASPQLTKGSDDSFVTP